ITPAVSNALVSQIDLLASLASLVGVEVHVHDSQDLMDVLLGRSNKGREELVIEAMTRTALRGADWVMILPYQGPSVNPNVNIERGNSQDYQLYHLKEALGQQNNLAPTPHEKLDGMIIVFEAIRSGCAEVGDRPGNHHKA